MAVVLSNARLSVEARSHAFARDARGTPVPTDADTITVRGPFPGAVKEQPDGSYSLRLDPRCWPVRAGDKIVATDGRVWYAAPDPILHQVPLVSDVDYVKVLGTIDPPRVP